MTRARSPAQWALPVAAIAAYLVAALVWVGNDRRAARAVFPHGSIWNTGDDGLSLAYAYLAARAAARPGGARVAVFTRRLESAPLPPRAVLLRVEPEEDFLDSLARRLGGGEGDEDDDQGPETGGDRGKPEKGAKAGKTEKGVGVGKTEQDARAGKSEPGAKARPPGAATGRAPRVGVAAPPSASLLTAAEEEWVRGGGRLVLAVAGSRDGVDVELAKAGGGGARKAFPIWPGVRRLLPEPTRTLAGRATAGMQALWLAGDVPVVARLALGAGDVVLLACPEVLHNRLLGRGDHLALLESLAGLGGDDGNSGDAGGGGGEPGSAGAGGGGTGGGGAGGGGTGGEGTGGGGTGGGGADGGGRPVYFDEWVHGAATGASMVEILASWGLGPMLLLVAVAGGAAWWRAAARLGPADRDDRDSRSEAVELLDSLAVLYDRALGRGDALRLYHESFVRTVAADTGLEGAALAARAAELTRGLSLAELPPSREKGPPGELAPATAPAAAEAVADLSRPAFDRLLDTLNQAFRRLDDAKRR